MSTVSLPNTIASGNTDDPTRDMANWNALVDVVNGGLDNTNIAAGAAIVQSKLSLNGYTTFATVWTATGNAPSIGNGTLTGRYAQFGKTVVYTIHMVIGSSTNTGSNTWLFSLPVTAASTIYDVGVAHAADTGTAFYTGVATLQSTTTLTINSHAAGGNWQSSGPFTWSTGDIMSVTITYEAA